MQKRAFFVSLGISVLSALPVLAANPVQELLPGGTQIPIHVVGTISSSSAKISDPFTIAASQDVVIDGRIVIKKGAQGLGEVISVNKAGGNGHSGSLGLKFAWIYAADGGKVQLSDSAQSNSEEDRRGASSTATIIGLATFGIGGLFGHNFAHGKDLVVDDTKKLTAFIASNVHVTTTEISDSPSDHFDK